MAGWSTCGTGRDVGQRDVDAPIILVSARDASFYSLFSLALATRWSGRSEARYAPATADNTGLIRLPVSITARLASRFYGEYRQSVAGYFKR